MIKRLPEPKIVIPHLYYMRFNERSMNIIMNEYDVHMEIDNLIEQFPTFFKNEKSNVLDIGSGHGNFTIAMGERFNKWNIYGIDSNNAAYEWSNELLSVYKRDNVQFIKQNLLELTDKKKYDRINMRLSLHHMNNIDATFDKTASIQSKGDMIYIFDFDRDYLKQLSVTKFVRYLRGAIPEKPLMNALSNTFYKNYLDRAVSYHAAYTNEEVINSLSNNYDIVDSKIFPGRNFLEQIVIGVKK